MPITYRIDLESNMLFIVGEGALTQDEKLEAMRRWMADPAYRPGLNTLYDFSAVTTPATLDDLKRTVAFVTRNAPALGKKRVAIVMANPLAFGVARQFQAMLGESSLEISVFRNREDALTWLGADPVDRDADDV